MIVLLIFLRNRISKGKRIFDLEERLIDFAARIIRTALIKPMSKLELLISENNELISIFVTSVKTAKLKVEKKTS